MLSRRFLSVGVLGATLFASCLAGCRGNDAASGTSESNVSDTNDGAKSDAFADALKPVIKLAHAPADDQPSVFGIRTSPRIALRDVSTPMAYFGDCAPEDRTCVKLFDPKTNHVQDASSLGVFTESDGVNDSVAWSFSPQRTWLTFQKRDGNEKAADTFLVASSDLANGAKAMKLDRVIDGRWISDSLFVQVVDAHTVRGFDVKRHVASFVVQFPAADFDPRSLPSLVASGDGKTLCIGTSAAAKLVTLGSDDAVKDVAGWKELSNPIVEAVPGSAGFVVTTRSEAYPRRVVLSTLDADGTIKSLADLAQETNDHHAVTFFPGGRMAWVRPTASKAPSSGTFVEDATVVIHGGEGADVELSARVGDAHLTVSSDGEWIQTLTTHARTNASGAMTSFVPTFDDPREVTAKELTPEQDRVIVNTRKGDDARLFVVDLASGKKTELLTDTANGTGFWLENNAAPSLFFAQGEKGRLVSLTGELLATVDDAQGAALGWKNGWLFYVSKPASKDGTPQLHALSRDGKQNIAIGASLDEVVILSGDGGSTIERFLVRSGLDVLALTPPMYEAKATTATPVTPVTIPGHDDGQEAPSAETGSDDTPAKKAKAKAKKATNEATDSEEPTVEEPETPATLPPMPATRPASCSSSPGAHGPAGFGVAFLVGLALFRRRRRSV